VSTCVRCGQLVDDAGLSYGRCHGCRTEYAYMKNVARLVGFPARGRNGKAVTPFRKVGEAQKLAELFRHPSIHYKLAENRKSLYGGLHRDKNALPVSAETASFARQRIEDAFPSFEDVPLTSRY
jgi:hypothetical protein